MNSPIRYPEKKLKFVGTSPIRPDGVPKVTGLAKYGSDFTLPGMLWGKILRSPHAHARILSINTAKAEALPGVKAVMTAADLPEQKFEYVGAERVAINFWHMTRNIMAHEKVLYEGHAVAAVAATRQRIANAALRLIEVEYEVLPHVIDVDAAMQPGAPLLFEDMITRGIEPPPAQPSNISKRLEFKQGDIDAGFAARQRSLAGPGDDVFDTRFTPALRAGDGDGGAGGDQRRYAVSGGRAVAQVAADTGAALDLDRADQRDGFADAGPGLGEGGVLDHAHA